MDSHNLAILIPILVPISMFTMVFGIVYLRNRERMAMIERGMDPRLNKPMNKPKSSGYNTFILTWGLLLMGAGVGLFLAYLLDHTVFKTMSEEDNPAIYFALIAIFGGAGLFLSYRIEKADVDKAE
jgi:hypothetical protein